MFYRNCFGNKGFVNEVKFHLEFKGWNHYNLVGVGGNEINTERIYSPLR